MKNAVMVIVGSAMALWLLANDLRYEAGAVALSVVFLLVMGIFD